MSNFIFSSSIGRKLVMSISGVCLLLFITFHMLMNITAVFSEDVYNSIAAFLGANWYALVGTALLAAGVAVHVFYGIWLTWKNYQARGQDPTRFDLQEAKERKFRRYAVEKRQKGVAWSSKNMLVLGLVVGIGLLVHLYNFWYNMQLREILGHHQNQFGYSVTDGAALMRDLFAQPVFCIIYLVWFAALWLHLTHGFWSMFQSVGWANKKWYPRLKVLGNILITLLILGFVAVVVVFYLKSRGIVIVG